VRFPKGMIYSYSRVYGLSLGLGWGFESGWRYGRSNFEKVDDNPGSDGISESEEFVSLGSEAWLREDFC
jgi:hypothetical protein